MKTKRISIIMSLLVVLLISFNLQAQDKWIYKLLNLPDDIDPINGLKIINIHCIDSTYCMAVAGLPWRPIIYLSTDRAKNWKIIQQPYIPNSKQTRVCSFAYPHKDHIFLGFEGSKISHSRDVGKTWDTINIATSDTTIDWDNITIKNIEMIDTLNGLLLTNHYFLTPGKKIGRYLMITDDGWKTWKTIQQGNLPNNQSVGSQDYAYMLNKDTILLFQPISGNGDTTLVMVVCSYNGGETWEVKDTLNNTEISGAFSMKPVYKTPNGSFFLAGFTDLGATGHRKLKIIHRLDKIGGTWAEIYRGEDDDYAWGLTGIAFADNLNGTATGPNTEVLRTNDGGKTWNKSYLSGSIGQLSSVVYCGNTPIIYSDIWIYWFLEAASPVNDNNNEVLGKFNIFPNPSSDFIEFRDIEDINSNIEIFSLLGEKLIMSPAGTRKLDIRSLPQGTYIAKNKGSLIKFIKF